MYSSKSPILYIYIYVYSCLLSAIHPCITDPCTLALLFSRPFPSPRRFCVPHVSDDEEPCASGSPPAPPTSDSNLQTQAPSLSDLEAADRDNSCFPAALDHQPTCLPKLRKNAPVYHQLNVLWAQAGGV